VETSIKPQYLKGISWKGGRLEFVSSKGRADFSNMRKLDGIKYFAIENQFVKSINFSYYNLAESADKRLMLSEILDSTAVGQRLVSKFEYLPYLIGKRNSRDYDHWGYYNGAGNTTNRPTIRIGNAAIVGANRTSILEYTAANCLKRVYNNWGGYTEYEYELNDAVMDNIQTPIGGIRVKYIKQQATSNDSLITRYYYKKCDSRGNMLTVSSGTIFSGSNYCLWAEGGGDKYNFLLSSQLLCDVFDINGSPVSYATVIVKKTNESKSIYEYTSNESHSDLPSKVYYIPPNSSVVQNNNLAVFVNTSRFWHRGLINEEKLYDKSNNLIHEKTYSYSFGSTAKEVVKGYQTYTSVFAGKKTRHLCEYEWTSEPVLLKTEYSTGQDVINTNTQYTYDKDNLVPIEITETQYAPYTKFKTTITYPFNYPTTTTEGDGFNQGIAWMNRRHMINYPIETIRFKNDIVVGGNLNEYTGALAIVALNNMKQLKINEPKTTYSPYACVNGKMVCDPDYEIISINDAYSLPAYAPTQTRAGVHGKPISVIYGYNNTVIIATATNATVNQIYHTSFEDVNGAIICDKAKTGEKVYRGIFNIPLNHLDAGQYLLTYWKSENNGVTWEREMTQITVSSTSKSYLIGSTSSYVDEVRVHPARALMTTATYKLGYGKTSETDENGYTVYYEYDGFGRIIKVLDDERHVMKGYQYSID
jgi:YD repeat protein